MADHGMAAVSGERLVFLDDYIDVSAVQITGEGPVATLDPLPAREADVEARLLGRHEHMECWRKGDMPARLAYGRHPRVPALVCLAETGWMIGTRARTDPARIRGGAHGYDNAAPEMRAVFIGHGPAFARGVVVPDMDSVDVQPLLGRLLGLVVPAGDGMAGDTAAIIRN